MLEILLISTFLTYVVPEDKHGRMPYPSGVKDFDEKNTLDYDASEYPVLTLPIPIYDMDKHIIPVGNYQTKVSPNSKEILLIQIGKTIGKIPLVRSVSFPVKLSVPEAKIESLGSKNLVIILKKDNMELYSIVYTQY